uniref:BTB domain-containing protein n=1 Tax=Heterorhabditis bacteriophora TaxID=37862 RepID=A0A1I7WPI9_HETBA
MSLEVIEDKRKVSITCMEEQTKKVKYYQKYQLRIVVLFTLFGDSLTLVPKRTRCAVSMRADETDKWGKDTLDEREDYQVMLRDPTIKNDLLDRLNTFRCNRELCDVVLFVSMVYREREIFAHKVVLAAVSPALFDMFLRENEDRDEGSNGATPPQSSGSLPQTNGIQFATTFAVAPSTKKPMAYFEFAQTDFECFNALVNFAYMA